MAGRGRGGRAAIGTAVAVALAASAAAIAFAAIQKKKARRYQLSHFPLPNTVSSPPTPLSDHTIPPHAIHVSHSPFLSCFVHVSYAITIHTQSILCDCLYIGSSI